MYSYSLPLDLFDPADPLEEALLYHDPNRWGFTAILRRTHDVQVDGVPMPVRPQRSYRLSELPGVLRHLNAQNDVWLAQNEFIRPNRRMVNLARLTTCFVDLDFYKLKHAWSSVEHAATALLRHLEQKNIPAPSVIVDSGRGMQIKWLIEGLPAQALPRWQAVQQALADALMAFGADKRALDASRVLRLVGTKNSRSGRLVKVIYANTVHRICFNDLANAVLPFTRQQLQELRRVRGLNAGKNDWEVPSQGSQSQNKLVAQQSGLKRLSVRQLWWDRLADFRKLVELRGWAGNVPEGYRDQFLWLSCVAICWTLPAPWVRKELRELGFEFASSLSEHERDSVLTATIARAEAAAQGKKQLFNGQELDPRYRISNLKLIDLFDITSEEESELKTIISKDVKSRRERERKTEKRRAHGMVERGTYLATAEMKRAQARVLRAQGKTWMEVASVVGYASAASARIATGKE